MSQPAHFLPDYATARREAGFGWIATGAVHALLALTGIPIREYFLNPSAAIEIYRRGWPLFQEMFGGDVSRPAVSTPHLSYGHVNGLGSELRFPEGGEPHHTPIHASLEEGIAALEQEVDFARAGMAPFYLDYRRQLQDAFPGETVGFPFGKQGPITTAWELRGHDFFTDLMDRPDLTAEYLRRITDSLVEFHRFLCREFGGPAIHPREAGITDDVASMVPPRLWNTLVLPFWNRYFEGITTGRRLAHVENLRAGHLRFLEQVGLSRYDPSISPQLNPRVITAGCRVPFMWRLGGFHYRDMSVQDVEDFVFQAAADGASCVFTVVMQEMCDEETAGKVRAFIRAAKEAKTELDAGRNRQELAGRVSPAGRKKYWDHWAGARGACPVNGHAQCNSERR